MDTFKTDESVRKQIKDVSDYNYDFENLAFEGGGAKMIAYAGVVKVTTFVFSFGRLFFYCKDEV